MKVLKKATLKGRLFLLLIVYAVESVCCRKCIL